MDIMEMVKGIQAVKDEVMDYQGKYTTLVQYDAYEEVLMAEAYYAAECTLSEEYGAEVMLEPSVQMGRGCVTVYIGNGEEASTATYDFEQETEAIWDVLSNSEAENEEEVIEAVAQTVVEFVHEVMD